MKIRAQNLALAATAAIVIGIGALLTLVFEKYLLAESRSSAMQSLDRATLKLDQILTKNLFTTYALATLIKQSNGEIVGFPGIAKEFIAQHPGISALQLAPKGVIGQTVPLAGNEKAIGHNLLTDEKRNKEARLALNTRQLTLAGPFDLIQGGEAIIGRMPVFLNDPSESFWGFAIALIRMRDLLEAVRLDDLEAAGYSYELWRMHPDTSERHVFAKSRSPLLAEPITASIGVPNGRWFLSLAPIAGWMNGARITAEIAIVLVLALLLCWTMRKYLLAQHALAESEARYRTLYKSTPAKMHSIDANGVIVSASDEWLKTFGFAREEVIGKMSSAFLTDASRRYAVETVLPDFFRSGRCDKVPYQMVAKDGRVIDILLSAYAERDAASNVVRSLAVIQDVTQQNLDRKRLEQLLAEQKAILENQLVGIVTVRDRTIIWANRAFEKMLGYGHGELNGTPTRNNYPNNEAYIALGAAGYSVLAEGGIFRSQIEHRRKDGTLIWVDISGSILHPDTGESLWCFLDISERKQLEHDIQEREWRMQALLDASPESTLLLNPAGTILAINKVGAGRFGLSPEAMCGKNFFDYVPEDIAESRRASLQIVAATCQPLQTHDSRGLVEFENNICPVKADDNKVESLAVYARDITELKRTQRLESIFQRLDMMQLKWQMDLPALAQVFCDEILPVFKLAAVWIAKAETGGTLALIASALENREETVAANLRNVQMRWDGQSGTCEAAANALRTGNSQKLAIEKDGCTACGVVPIVPGAQVVHITPLTLRGKPWGVVAYYGREREVFEQVDIPPRLASITTRLSASLESSLKQEWLILLDTALATVGSAVFMADASGLIVWVNPAFERLSGYRAEEVVGKTPKYFSSGAQDAAFYANFWKTIVSGQTWRGELVNQHKDGRQYTVSQTVTALRNANGDISHFVSIQEDISERKLAEARIQYMANFDALTDLPNRTMFFDRLKQAIALAKRDSHIGALLFLDLDRFKQVNDQLGHRAGDLLLKTVALRLRSQVRETDTVARLAGDEFTVILPHIATLEHAIHVAEKIIASLSIRFDLGEHEAHIGASIGIALFPDHGEHFEQLVHAADHAMYAAKQAGRNTYSVYRPEAKEGA